ncbi:unnamed protein product [Protopolystoma xenopodis]|uniref:TFIIS N-terminal domain-containing protein n=1 Tax=Protopolystoma xenopodis TaxID=117903 RepID=A0A448X337_9PLAT|nr:unnamed protein product [Protopolystoma xenopodis]
MTEDVISCLKKFGEALGSSSISSESVGLVKYDGICCHKLKVLDGLSDANLTLNELYESGVGRAVSKLKGEPGLLGKAARDLVLKWRNLLNDHLRRENIDVLPDLSEKNYQELDSPKKLQMLAITKDKCLEGKEIQRKLQKPPTAGTLKGPFLNGDANFMKTDHIPSPKADDVSKLTIRSNISSPLSETPSHSSSKEYVDKNSSSGGKTVKRKLSSGDKKDGSSDYLDSSSGLSFMECLTSISSNSSKRQTPKKTTPKSSKLKADEPASFFIPSKEFSKDIISSLSQPCVRPDAIHPDHQATLKGRL